MDDWSLLSSYYQAKCELLARSDGGGVLLLLLVVVVVVLLAVLVVVVVAAAVVGTTTNDAWASYFHMISSRFPCNISTTKNSQSR